MIHHDLTVFLFSFRSESVLRFIFDLGLEILFFLKNGWFWIDIVVKFLSKQVFLFLMNSIVQVVDVHSSPNTSEDIVDIEHFNSIVHVVDVHPPPTTSLETVDSEHCNSFSHPDDESLLT